MRCLPSTVRPHCLIAAGLVVLGVTTPVRAEVDLGALLRRGMPRLPRALGERVSSIVELPAGSARPQGFVRIGETPSGSELGVVEVLAGGFPELARANPTASFGWSPPLR